MPETPLNWVVPAARTVAKNREQVRATLEALWAKLWGRKFRVGFTGMSGAGKTALFDCLTGRAFRTG